MTEIPNELIPLERQETQECIEAIDPKKFKYLYEEEKIELELEGAKLISPLQLIALNTIALQEKKEIDVSISVSSLNLILDTLVEHTGLVIHTMITQDLQKTSVIIQAPLSLLDQVEIIVTQFESAPGALNIEIKSCDKLQALLHKHQGSFLTQLGAARAYFTINRLDLGLHSSMLNKDKIKGSPSKKVTQGSKTSDDNQA